MPGFDRRRHAFPILDREQGHWHVDAIGGGGGSAVNGLSALWDYLATGAIEYFSAPWWPGMDRRGYLADFQAGRALIVPILNYVG